MPFNSRAKRPLIQLHFGLCSSTGTQLLLIAFSKFSLESNTKIRGQFSALQWKEHYWGPYQKAPLPHLKSTFLETPSWSVTGQHFHAVPLTKILLCDWLEHTSTTEKHKSPKNTTNITHLISFPDAFSLSVLRHSQTHPATLLLRVPLLFIPEQLSSQFWINYLFIPITSEAWKLRFHFHIIL